MLLWTLTEFFQFAVWAFGSTAWQALFALSLSPGGFCTCGRKPRLLRQGSIYMAMCYRCRVVWTIDYVPAGQVSAVRGADIQTYGQITGVCPTIHGGAAGMLTKGQTDDVLSRWFLHRLNTDPKLRDEAFGVIVEQHGERTEGQHLSN